MRILIFSFSNNKVNEDSFIPNEKGLTFSCVDECINELNKQEIQNEHICINYKNIKMYGLWRTRLGNLFKRA